MIISSNFIAHPTYLAVLIDSWTEEIRQYVSVAEASSGVELTFLRHTYPGYIKFHKHHGQGREDEESQKGLLNSDIVFTTYATVAAEARKARSVLGCISWFRIVLDEGLSKLQWSRACSSDFVTAHEIRNPSTKQYKSVAALKAEYRWCLTGTPIQNSVEDLGALVSFLRVPIVQNPGTFRKFIVNPSTSDSRERFKNLRMLLGSICLRRTRELIKLPDPKVQLRCLDFSESERREYENIERQCRRHIDAAVSGHGRAKVNSAVLQSLLQLRLFCNNGGLRRQAGTASPGKEMDMDEVLSYLQQKNEGDCAYCVRPIYSISDAHDTDGGLLVSGCLHLICRSCMPRYHAEGSRCPLHPVGEVLTSIHLSADPAHSVVPEARARYPTKLLAFLDDISKQLSQKRYMCLSNRGSCSA
jgi:SWI/SNF-related matrix-associated actin-dependent regulator of chromatin subfamily A3